MRIARAVRRPLRRLHRGVLVLRARDVTEATASRSALVLAPHCDDESLACGATIATKTAAGARVRVVVIADAGNVRRRAETVAACAVLGVPAADVTFLGFPEMISEDHAAAMDAALATYLDGLEEPFDELYLPALPDEHPAHRALAASVARVAAGHCPGSARLAYPVWYWRRAAWVDADASLGRKGVQLVVRSTLALVTSKTVIVRTGPVADCKRRAITAHASQVSGAGPDGRQLSRYTLELFEMPEELFFVEAPNGQSSKRRWRERSPR